MCFQKLSYQLLIQNCYLQCYSTYFGVEASIIPYDICLFWRQYSLPVIVASGLSSVRKEKLIRVLHDHDNAIGWTIVDIKGISPSLCMHMLLLEDGAKQSLEVQR